MDVLSRTWCCSLFLPSSNECKSLFNTRAFYCSERIFLVNKSFIVLQDLTSSKTIIQALSSKTIVVISQHLDLTLLYADWTCQEINGTPTKSQVSKRQVSKCTVSKCTVSKRPVSKRQVYKTSGLQNIRFQNVQFLNLIYLLNKKYRNCQVSIPI